MGFLSRFQIALLHHKHRVSVPCFKLHYFIMNSGFQTHVSNSTSTSSTLGFSPMFHISTITSWTPGFSPMFQIVLLHHEQRVSVPCSTSTLLHHEHWISVQCLYLYFYIMNNRFQSHVSHRHYYIMDTGFQSHVSHRHYYIMDIGFQSHVSNRTTTSLTLGFSATLITTLHHEVHKTNGVFVYNTSIVRWYLFRTCLVLLKKKTHHHAAGSLVRLLSPLIRLSRYLHVPCNTINISIVGVYILFVNLITNISIQKAPLNRRR